MRRKHLKPRSPVTETPNHVAADKPRTKVIQISNNVPARPAAERLVVRSTLAKEAHDCHGMEGRGSSCTGTRDECRLGRRWRLGTLEICSPTRGSGQNRVQPGAQYSRSSEGSSVGRSF